MWRYFVWTKKDWNLWTLSCAGRCFWYGPPRCAKLYWAWRWKWCAGKMLSMQICHLVIGGWSFQAEREADTKKKRTRDHNLKDTLLHEMSWQENLYKKNLSRMKACFAMSTRRWIISCNRKILQRCWLESTWPPITNSVPGNETPLMVGSNKLVEGSSIRMASDWLSHLSHQKVWPQRAPKHGHPIKSSPGCRNWTHKLGSWIGN